MSKLKQQVIQMIKKLPDKVSVDDILAELYFRLQVDKGLKELDESKGNPHGTRAGIIWSLESWGVGTLDFLAGNALR